LVRYSVFGFNLLSCDMDNSFKSVIINSGDSRTFFSFQRERTAAELIFQVYFRRRIKNGGGMPSK
jgi:hypothetical protein